jgi:hypothetical protein
MIIIDKLFFWIYCVPSAKFDPEEKNSLSRLDFIRNSLFLIVGFLSVLSSLLNASTFQTLISMIIVSGLCVIFVIVRYTDERINTLCNVNIVQLKSGRYKGITFSILSCFICFGGMYFALG